MATVYFSSGLARYTGGVERLSVDASRVRELMEALTERFPELAQPLDVMAIAVDGEVYQEPEYMKLAPDTEIHFVPQVAGG